MTRAPPPPTAPQAENSRLLGALSMVGKGLVGMALWGRDAAGGGVELELGPVNYRLGWPGSEALCFWDSQVGGSLGHSELCGLELEGWETGALEPQQGCWWWLYRGRRDGCISMAPHQPLSLTCGHLGPVSCRHPLGIQQWGMDDSWFSWSDTLSSDFSCVTVGSSITSLSLPPVCNGHSSACFIK